MNGHKDGKQALLRQLPSVDALLKLPESAELQTLYGRTLTVEALRQILDNTRETIANSERNNAPDSAEIISEAAAWLEGRTSQALVPVINATGIIVHTNLGRAPLSEAALSAVHNISQGYSNLEYDIDQGTRGSRSIHASELLKQITGAEDAFVVNNNAAAVLLTLSGLCKDREVIISRGQLVEIGGGFRVPDVMVQSGARLVEVGTTNRTHQHDYERAITENTAAILVAHHSNFQIVGFTSEPELSELAELAHRHSIPLLYDQGSGALLDVRPFGLDHEPTVRESLGVGVDLIAFSGDKLLGGPQAGIICGRGVLISTLKKHPLARAMRADKTCLAALTATLVHYLRDEALVEIPIWQMISRSEEGLETEAGSWAERLNGSGIPAGTISGRSRVGGGSLPGSSLPTTLVAVSVEDVDALAARLRQAANPVIGRVQDNQFLLDPRTILPAQTEILLQTMIEEFSRHE